MTEVRKKFHLFSAMDQILHYDHHAEQVRLFSNLGHYLDPY